MKESKFEISKFTPSGGKNIGIRKSEFVTKTQFLYKIQDILQKHGFSFTNP